MASDEMGFEGEDRRDGGEHGGLFDWGLPINVYVSVGKDRRMDERRMADLHRCAVSSYNRGMSGNAFLASNDTGV